MTNASDPLTEIPEGFDADLLKELEAQTRQQVQVRRGHDRHDITVNVQLRPGNSSDRSPDIHGTSMDVSRGGCRLQFEMPIGVGDLYRLTFASNGVVDARDIFVRCQRCILVREDTFEAGFSFFSPVELSSPSSTDADGALITDQPKK
jgi:hypothetical protein